MSQTVKIEFSHITKTFIDESQTVNALSDVSLQIHQNSIYGIIGMSGAGKSTLVRLINGLTTYDEGELFVNGVELKTLSEKEMRKLRSKIGMIFQHFNLLQQKTVLDNVLLSLKLNHTNKEEAKAKALQYLQLVGLEDKINAYPSQLSGGQKQRVAIARALVNSPDILLCDEPTSALDPISTQNILALLKELHQKLDLTIVIITHEMKVIEEICNEVAILDAGKVVEQGSVTDIFIRPQSQAAKKLLFVQEVEPLDFQNATQLRLIFEGQSALEPVISQLVLKTSQAINILWANTKEVEKKVYGQMLIQVSSDPKVLGHIVETLERLNVLYSIEGGEQ